MSGYFLRHPDWGTLINDPREGVCAMWSTWFPYGEPRRFETQEDAEIVRQLWDGSMPVCVMSAVQLRFHEVMWK